MAEQIVAIALLGGDWVLYLLVALSILSVAVVIERSIFFGRRRIDSETLQRATVKALAEDDVEALRKTYEESKAMPARVALVTDSINSRCGSQKNCDLSPPSTPTINPYPQPSSGPSPSPFRAKGLRRSWRKE